MIEKLSKIISFNVPFLAVIVLLIFGIFSGFGMYPKCNPDYAKPDTIYVNIPSIKVDTFYVKKTVYIEKPAIIDTTNKKDFVASAKESVGDSGFIEVRHIISDVSISTYQELLKKNMRFNFNYKLPTIEVTKMVPIKVTNSEKYMYRLQGSLATITAAIIVGGIVYYFNIKSK